MRFTELPLRGSFLVSIDAHVDERGLFARAFCEREFQEHGLKTNIVQCNLSQNHKQGTLRGMHYQRTPFAEVKMVRCIRGVIYDVIIDIQPDSPTFLKWSGVTLSAANRDLLYVPEGFAHGYQCLADDTEVLYMVTQFYEPSSEAAIRWNDPAVGIEWPISDPILSSRDASHPDFLITAHKGA